MFTGIDSRYEPPAQPALELRTDHEPLEFSAEKLFDFALSFAQVKDLAKKFRVA